MVPEWSLQGQTLGINTPNDTKINFSQNWQWWIQGSGLGAVLGLQVGPSGLVLEGLLATASRPKMGEQDFPYENIDVERQVLVDGLTVMDTDSPMELVMQTNLQVRPIVVAA